MAQKTVAVVGGGVAGAAAALELARAGARVELVEQDDYLGGHAARLACKALEDCQGCNGCLAESRLREVLEHPGVRIRRRSYQSYGSYGTYGRYGGYGDNNGHSNGDANGHATAQHVMTDDDANYSAVGSEDPRPARGRLTG